jgi:putative ABC transport system permease protein
MRWAWRLFRREWRQQALVLGLVTVAVAICVGGSAFAVNSATPGRGLFGDAGALIRLDAHDPQLDVTLAAARRRFGAYEIVGHQVVAVPGSPQPLDLRSQDPHGRFSAPTLGLRSGRYPTTDDEVALTKGALAELDTRVGARVTLGRVSRTVVGVVENSGDLHDDFGLLAPSARASADALTMLVASPQGPGSQDRGPAQAGVAPTTPPIGFRVEGAPRDDQTVGVTVLMITTVSLALVALIAAAGFVVVAQRRQRQLGLLDAIGATERNLRLVTVANGMIVGVVAAVVGGALGVVGWIAGAPALEAGIGHRVDRLALPWTLIFSCLGLAVLAGTAAAWWPARMMARQPTMSALSRRPARPAPIYRSLLAAAAMFGLGTALIVAAHPTRPRVSAAPLIGGLVAMILGSVLVTPSAVRLLALPARRLPFAPRLALRDLARNQARAASALAAITLGLGISVAIMALAQLNQYDANEGNLSSRQMLVATGDGPTPTSDQASLAAADEARKTAAANAIAAKVGGDAVALEVALSPHSDGGAQVAEPIGAVRKVNEHSFSFAGRAYVATPEVLAALGIDPSTINPSADILTSLKGKVIVFDSNVRPDPDTQTTKRQHMDRLGAFTSAPTTLITEKAMSAHGWTATPADWFVRAPKALTSEQITAARKLAANAGLTVEVRSSQDDLAALRTGATAVGVVLALAIVAMTMGLLRGESTADLRTLTATGASAQVRRALTASTAGALALVGVVLSIGGAYATLVAAYHAELGDLIPLPLTNLLLLLFGLPVLAVAGGWLLAGREPATFARQLTE